MSNNQPTKGYRTFVLLLLTVVYGFNFIDRQIVGILAPFIQEDLGLTNTELGLLIGLAFAIFYTTVANAKPIKHKPNSVLVRPKSS
jgi:sugar phosphate permease